MVLESGKGFGKPRKAINDTLSAIFFSIARSLRHTTAGGLIS
jgi:hypothetical protein